MTDLYDTYNDVTSDSYIILSLNANALDNKLHNLVKFKATFTIKDCTKGAKSDLDRSPLEYPEHSLFLHLFGTRMVRTFEQGCGYDVQSSLMATALKAVYAQIAPCRPDSLPSLDAGRIQAVIDSIKEGEKWQIAFKEQQFTAISLRG
jgi:hypothetical protein